MARGTSITGNGAIIYPELLFKRSVVTQGANNADYLMNNQWNSCWKILTSCETDFSYFAQVVSTCQSGLCISNQGIICTPAFQLTVIKYEFMIPIMTQIGPFKSLRWLVPGIGHRTVSVNGHTYIVEGFWISERISMRAAIPQSSIFHRKS